METSEIEMITCIICKTQFPLFETREHACFAGVDERNLFTFNEYVGPGEDIDTYIEEMFPKYLDENNEFINGTEQNKKRRLNHNATFDRDNDDLEIVEIENVELNKSGNAKKSTENYLVLLELVKEFPIIWNHKLPIEQRPPLAKSKAWNKILQSFPGWSRDFMIKKFQSLKDVYMKRKAYVPSGSAQRAQKYWVFEDSFSFMKGIIEPASTISNVPQASQPNTSDNASNNNTESALKDLGFDGRGKLY
ncbi:uncharacterized protein LOC122512035 [Leptopilina heterotoma]|uniref:uncharacterized protein LOC122512035 n=1 Tax=Leptopilina heterotoma TaxID=63436 RepID=UPI001CAA212C|nr:uncharacterized protein LOC122512035 [Leptopilina heterotoma]